MSVWEETFGIKTVDKGAGSRSAWRFDLLWRIICEIVCCASVPQPHLKMFLPAATGYNIENILFIELNRQKMHDNIEHGNIYITYDIMQKNTIKNIFFIFLFNKLQTKMFDIEMKSICI